MKIYKDKTEKQRLLQIKSRRNHFEMSIGITKKMGIFGGIQIEEDFDWWNLIIGFTFLCFFFSVRFHWRVFGCGYDRRDSEDIYF